VFFTGFGQQYRQPSVSFPWMHSPGHVGRMHLLMPFRPHLCFPFFRWPLAFGSDLFPPNSSAHGLLFFHSFGALFPSWSLSSSHFLELRAHDSLFCPPPPPDDPSRTMGDSISDLVRLSLNEKYVLLTPPPHLAGRGGEFPRQTSLLGAFFSFLLS